MKKKLEAELISIAHRILKIKNKEDVRELHHETQKLYEKLSVLLFVEENFEDVKPTIGLHDIEVKIEHAFDFDEKIIVAQLNEEEEVEELAEKILTSKTETKEPEKVEIVPPPIETKTKETSTELSFTENKEAPIIAIPTPEKKQISFDDILNEIQPVPIFERVSDSKKEELIPAEINKIIEDKIDESPKKEKVTEFVSDFKEIAFEKVSEKPSANLNDKMTKNSGLTLNDRVAFEKNLFDGSAEDLNRVISQIATFDNFTDAKNFIEEMVKPDYNEWEGKDEFASRFMEFVESKFA
jgi:hypothetical protein